MSKCEKLFRSAVLLIVFALLLLFVSCRSSEKDVEFDDNNIVLRFAAMSDVHIDTSYTHGKNAVKFDNALKYIKEITDNELDVLFFAGDITERFSIANHQLVTFQKIIEQNFNVADGEIEVIIGTGNHDSVNGTFCKKMHELLGDDYYRTDLDRESMLKGNRHCVVNGFHFITVEPEHYGDMPSKYSENALNVRFSEETLAWLDEILAKITKDDPRKPVFLASHAMIYDTVYGSATPGWYTENLGEVISKYPQVFVFSGHMHNQLNNERAIMQTDFTALDCGGLKSLGGGNIIDQRFTKCINFTSDDRQSFAQGLLVEVDAKNNTRIRRLDFTRKEEIGNPWVIPAPAKNKSHLKIYTKDRANQGSPPYFEDIASVRIDIGEQENRLSVTFDAAKGDNMIYYYTIEINPVNGTGDSETYYFSSKSFLYPKVEDMPDSYTAEIKKPSPGKYSITIKAVDIWDKTSEGISAEFITE